MIAYGDRTRPGQFVKGERVELHPALDAWMQGDRFGTVVGLGRVYVAVQMDRSGRTLKITPGRLKDFGKVD